MQALSCAICLKTQQCSKIQRFARDKSKNLQLDVTGLAMVVDDRLFQHSSAQGGASENMQCRPIPEHRPTYTTKKYVNNTGNSEILRGHKTHSSVLALMKTEGNFFTYLESSANYTPFSNYDTIIVPGSAWSPLQRPLYIHEA
jgi:hypothetical protein